MYEIEFHSAEHQSSEFKYEEPQDQLIGVTSSIFSEPVTDDDRVFIIEYLNEKTKEITEYILKRRLD